MASKSQEPIRLAVIGAGGRMGCRIIALAGERPDLKVTGALEAKGHPAIGSDAGMVAGCGALHVTVTSDPDKALAGTQVAIDFTAPSAVPLYAAAAAEHGVALVVGSTGLTGPEEAIIAGAAERVPVLVAPNMSIGVNLLFRLVPQIAAALGGEYEIEILEAHHNKKKDAPSGTALGLLDRILEVRESSRDQVVYGREGMIGARRPHEIGVHAIRAADIVGEHTVLFATAGERIEITHRASSRDTFARGALRAALFLAAKPAGRYAIADVLFGANA